MKPVRLQFSGINSFSEQTVIDFEELSRNGIFGIFGETGSGKSTILDCINFALYGDVERSKEKTDIINYKSASASVVFEFRMVHDGKSKLYTVKRTIKKDKSGTHKAELYEKDEDGEVCIADKASAVESKIVEILGLNADDFRKCIALPQGEFSQFVKSVPRERLALIERLFSLGRYGDRLKERISEKQAEADGRYQNIYGKLEAYGDVSDEQLESVAKQIEEHKKALGELTEKSAAVAKEYERLSKLYEKHCELRETEQKLDALGRELPAMQELKKRLSVMPVCAELVQADGERDNLLKQLQKLNAELDGVRKLRAKEEDKLKNTLKTLEAEDLDKKIEECSALAAKFALSEGKPAKLNELTRQLQEKRNEYKLLDGEKKKLAQAKAAAEESVAQAEKALEALNTDNADSLLTSVKGAVLKSEYAGNLDWFARFGGDIKTFKDDSPLYNFVEGRVNEKISEYKERLIGIGEFDFGSAEGVFENLKKNRELQRAAQDKLNEKRQYLQELTAKIAVKDKETETSLKQGGDLRARADELREELEKIFGSECKDFEGAVAENSRKLSALTERRKTLNLQAERLKTSLESLNISVGGIMARAQTLQESLSAAEEKVNKLLKTSGFEDIAACKKFYEEFEHSDGEKTLSEYDAKVNAAKVRLAELKSVEGIDGFNEDALKAVKAEKEQTEEDEKRASGELAVLKSNFASLQARLAEKKEIIKQFESVQRERNLILKLKEATKGNKFLEYIATEYLMDISALASSTLLNLTDGRYYLVYENNNFQVSDNYDCGNLRGVNTLSGGETFLVSLSLALALSQTICAKSNKTIEFFFLDEGFGTLDNNLLDTVMNALEKLKSSRFTIGIISHVEELKHRIESKITVNKATETHGSTVVTGC